MIVARKVNKTLQAFNAWQHRINIDSQVKASSVQEAYSTLWKNPNGTAFTPHGLTVTSSSFASAATANDGSWGLL